MADITITFTMGQQTSTLTIPSAKVQDFAAGFLKAKPIPILDNGNPEFASTLDWFVAYIKRHSFRVYSSGKNMIRAEQDAGIDSNIITGA